jgi:hypothetical protein
MVEAARRAHGSGLTAEAGAPPAFILAHAHEAGPIAIGSYRVVSVWNRSHGETDHTSLDAARKHADDVASEADYDDLPPAAYVFDSHFTCVDVGIHFSLRKPGKTALESSGPGPNG